MKVRRRKPKTAPEPPPGENGFSLISKEKLFSLYKATLQCRMLARRIRREFADRLRRRNSQEAPAVGVAIDLLDGDLVCAADGSVLPEFVKGESAESIAAALRGRSQPVRERGWHPPAVSGLPARALKAARRMKREKKNVAVVFCGAGAQSLDGWEGALHATADEALPLLLVCCRQSSKADLAAKAERCGFPVFTVDGADVVAIYRVASECIAHARRGNGPTLIVCKPWRGGKSKRKRGKASAASPVRNLEHYLKGKGLPAKKFKNQVVERFAEELDEAFAAAKRAAKAASQRTVDFK